MSEGTLTINVRAIDEATKEISSIKGGLISAAEEMAEANEKLATSNERTAQAVQVSKKELAGAIGTITSAAVGVVNLYQQFDRLEKMQLQASKSALALEKAQARVADIQSKLTKLESEGKKGTEEYEKTLRDLELAQETVSVASERLSYTQENISQSYLTFGLTVVPTVISMLGSLSAAKQSLTVVTHALNAAMAANPIGIIVVAIGLLIAALVTAYQTCEPFRNAVNALGSALSKVLQPAIAWLGEKMTWLWNNVIVPVIGVLKQLWDTITGNPILAALFGPITSIAYLIGHWKEVTQALGGALNWLNDNVIKPVADKLLWFYNTILKPIYNIIGGVVSAISGAGSAITGGAKAATTKTATTTKTGGTTAMVPIPKGTWVVEHRSPVTVRREPEMFAPHTRMALPSWQVPARMERGYFMLPPEMRGAGGGGVAGGGGIVHVTAAPSVTVQITGAVQPAMVPVISREVQKATYQGMSESLRDDLRRKGVKIWRGY